MHLQRREVIEIVLCRGVGCCLEKLPSSCTLRHENVCTLWAIDEERVGTRLNGRHNLCNRPFPLALHACMGNVALPIFADVFDHCICHSCTPIRLVPPYVGSSPSSHAALTRRVRVISSTRSCCWAERPRDFAGLLVIWPPAAVQGAPGSERCRFSLGGGQTGARPHLVGDPLPCLPSRILYRTHELSSGTPTWGRVGGWPTRRPPQSVWSSYRPCASTAILPRRQRRWPPKAARVWLGPQ